MRFCRRIAPSLSVSGSYLIGRKTPFPFRTESECVMGPFAPQKPAAFAALICTCHTQAIINFGGGAGCRINSRQNPRWKVERGLVPEYRLPVLAFKLSDLPRGACCDPAAGRDNFFGKFRRFVFCATCYPFPVASQKVAAET